MLQDQFVEHSGIYLLNHSVGRPPVSSESVFRGDFIEPWQRGDDGVWPFWLQQIERFRTALGSLLNAAAEDFCPQTNLSSALTKLVYSLPQRKHKQTILLHEDSFPSMGFVLQLATRSGFMVKMIPADLDPADINVWDDFLSDEVDLALIIHVHSNTSVATPVSEILELTKERGVTSIVDIAQSVGVVPVDVSDWNADFVLGSCVKWLCGGPGAGFLWVHPDRVLECEPVDVGWFSHEDPFEFDIHNFRYAQGALRFWGGTPSVMPYVLAANSIELIESIGVCAIQKHNHELIQSILDGVDPKIIVSPVNRECRGGTMVLNFCDRQEEIEHRLRAAEVEFDARSTGIRLSPHIYNTALEIEIVRDCIQ